MGAAPHADLWDEVAALLSHRSSLLERAEGFGSSATRGQSLKSAVEQGARLLKVGDGVEQWESWGSGWTHGLWLDVGGRRSDSTTFPLKIH